MPQSFIAVFLLLSGCYVLNPMGLDATLPAIAAMAEAMHATTADVQFSLAALTFGMALGQILFGAVTDRFGRRAVLLPCVAVFTVCSVAIPLFPHIDALIGLRFLQGLMAAAAIIVARAVVRDLYDRAQAAKLFAYLFMALGTVPIFGPPLGGWLTGQFGWKWVFAMVTVVGFIVFFANLLFLRETLVTRDHGALRLGALAESFSRIIGNRTFVAYTATATICYAGLFAILAAMAPVLIDFMGQTPSQFGFQFAVALSGHLVASWISGRIVGRFGINRLIVPGASLCALSGLSAAVLALSGIAVPAAIIWPSFAFMVGFAFVVAPAMAGALSPFPEMAGRASSLLGFLQMGLGATTMAVVGVFDDGTQIPMVTALAICGVICVLLSTRLPSIREAHA